MNTITNMIKMDLAICKKATLIMTVSLIIAGIGCLFYFTPLLLGIFVAGSTAVVSAIFSVENKSNMEFFYGCLPIKKSQYVISRSITCLLILTIPSVISIVFMQLSIHFSLCKNEDVQMLLEATDQYQMLILCGLIMLGFMGGANLLVASFIGKPESREMMEVLLLFGEAFIMCVILFVIKSIFFKGDYQEFLDTCLKNISEHEAIFCVVLICIGLISMLICSFISIRVLKSRTTPAR